MRKFAAWGLATLVMGLSVGLADAAFRAGDGLDSGVQVGDAVAPFDVQDITGPNKGNTLCYRCQYGQNPVVCVFARETAGPVANLIKQVDEKITKDNGLKAFVVVLTDDAKKSSSTLEELAKSSGIKSVPLTLIANTKGPDDYQIAKNADVTVMMWKNGKVVVNHAYAKGKMTDADVKTIVSEVPKMLGD